MIQNQSKYLDTITKGTSGLRVVCFPHAGGSASWYRAWTQDAQSLDVTLEAVQYPGHQGQLKHPWASSVPHLAALVGQQLEHDSQEVVLFGHSMGALVGQQLEHDSQEVVLFGHSMGALVAFEVALQASQRGIRYQGLHLSGSRAPSIPLLIRKSSLKDPALIKAVGDLAPGVPNALEYPEIADLFLPIVRHDFKIAEDYQSDASLGNQDVFIHAGKSDPEFPPQEVEHWKRHTRGSITLSCYDGGHFFLQDQGYEILSAIKQSTLATALLTSP